MATTTESLMPQQTLTAGRYDSPSYEFTTEGWTEARLTADISATHLASTAKSLNYEIYQWTGAGWNFWGGGSWQGGVRGRDGQFHNPGVVLSPDQAPIGSRFYLTLDLPVSLRTGARIQFVTP